MNDVLDKSMTDQIDDEYIKDNLDEILDIMLNLTNDKQKKGNWKRALKAEGVSKNVLYFGWAALHKVAKMTNNLWKRIDNIYERESVMTESMRESQEYFIRNQKTIDEFRAIQGIILKKLKSQMKNYDYGEFIHEELKMYNRGFYGF